MDVSLYQAAAAMSANAQWQDLIAENLSSASIPGARKQEMTFADVQAGLSSGTAQQAGFFIPTATPATNFQTGETRQTGNSTDFALDGPGFFSVQMPDGQTAYTRDGEFSFNSSGQLVTKQGYQVMGQSGQIHLNPNNTGAITVSATGEVSQGDQKIGTMAVTDFNTPSKLTRIGSGFFTPDTNSVKGVPSTTTKVRQGYVEGANMSPTTEMASMITSMRMFEANQKVLQMQSDRMSRVITDLGGTSS